MSAPSLERRTKADLERGARHIGYEFEAMMAMPVLIRSADREGNWALGGRRHKKRMHYRDFLPTWTGPVSPEATSLRGRIGPLIAHLAHLFWDRVIRPSPSWPYPTIADEVLTIFGSFAVALASDSPRLAARSGGRRSRRPPRRAGAAAQPTAPQSP